MKSFDASDGSPTKKYVVIVDLNAPAAAGDVVAFALGVVEPVAVMPGAVEVPAEAAGAIETNARGVGVLLAHAANETASASAPRSESMMDNGFMVGHSTSLNAI